MLLGQNSDLKWTVIGFTILVFILPIFDRRKWLWWLWLSSTVFIILLVDLHRHSNLLLFDRYAMIVAPAVYAILAIPINLRKLGEAIPIASLFAAIVYGAAHYQQGPDITLGSTYQLEDHRAQCAFIKRNIQSDDLLILSGLSSFSPFSYFLITHYNAQPTYPVILLWSPITPDLKHQMLHYKHIWMMGSNPTTDTKTLLPGSSPINIHGTTYFDPIWQVNLDK